MQTCPSCQHPLPTSGVFFYCPNCPQQVRCKNCHEALLPGAKRCVMCGTPVDQGNTGQSGSVAGSGAALTPAINTLKYVETNKGYSREIEVSLSNEVGIAWGGAAISGIISGNIIPGKPPTVRPGIRDLNNDNPQQLSLLENEPDSEKTNATTNTNTVAQLPAAKGGDAENLRRIFRHNGEQLQLMETRLKATSKMDAARRLTFLTLFYYSEVDRRDEIPRSDLNDILKRVGLYDNNTATWIGKSADLIVTGEMVGLRLPGQELARQALADIFDPSIEGKWSLNSGTASRSSKSNGKSEEDSENSTKNGKHKHTQFSQDVESWVDSFKQFASNLNIHAIITDCNATQKGCLALWAIGKLTQNPDVVVSGSKLAQFLYLGLGIKVDESNLRRSLKAISGQGNVIAVNKGFRLLTPGQTEAEKLIGCTQEDIVLSNPSEDSDEA